MQEISPRVPWLLLAPLCIFLKTTMMSLLRVKMSLFDSSEMRRRRVSESAQAGRKNLQTQTLMGDGAGMEVKLLGGLIQRCGHRLRGCFGSPRTVLTCAVRREHRRRGYTMVVTVLLRTHG